MFPWEASTSLPSHTHTQRGRSTMTEKPHLHDENSSLFFDVWTFNQYALVKRIAMCIFTEAKLDSVMCNRS